MQDNFFLSALKIAFTGILAFLVFMAFWQRTHVEEQVQRLTTDTSALKDRVGEMSRKLDELASKSDRLEGAAQTISTIIHDRLGTGTAPVAPKTPPVESTADWGWSANAGFDASLDASKPIGTPGRFANYLTLDTAEEIPAEARDRTKGTLSSLYGNDPKGWNFLTENAAELQEIMEVYCADSPCSVHYADPYKFAPAVCWRAEVSPDFREYTLFFRRDVVWHPAMVDFAKYPHLAGSHRVTAKDFKFTLDMIVNPQTDCAPLRGYYTDMESVECPDDWTCVVRWKKTVWHSKDFTLGRAIVPEFLFGFDEKGRPLPKETAGSAFNTHFYNQIGVCGCGAYRLASVVRGQWITLERFDDWYGAKEGRRYPIRTKKLLIYNDPETPLLKIQSDEVDLVGLTATQWKAKVVMDKDPGSPFNDGRIKTFKTKRPVYRYFGWKNSLPMFGDKNVRRALSHALNRAAICSKIYLDKLVPMSVPVFPDSPQSDPSIVPHAFDLALARKLLDDAGWALDPETGIRRREIDGKFQKLEFSLLYTTPNPDGESAINQYRNDLRSIGVVMNPEGVEWSLFQQKIHDREFQAVLGGWAGQSWDHDFDQIFHSRQIEEPSSSNYCEFKNAEFDALQDSLRTEMDVSKRAEKIKAIARIFYEEQPYAFFAWDNNFGAHRAHLMNVLGHIYKQRPFLRTFPMWTAR